jgi:hypothetical protein
MSMSNDLLFLRHRHIPDFQFVAICQRAIWGNFQVHLIPQKIDIDIFPLQKLVPFHPI